jgi:hypothetical protein
LIVNSAQLAAEREKQRQLEAATIGYVETIMGRHPEWAGEVLDGQGRPYGRSGAFFAELIAVNPARVYERLRCSVAILYGASDFVAMRSDQDAIEGALAAGGNPDHVLLLLPDCDHAFAYAPTGQLYAYRAGDRLADGVVRAVESTDVLLETEEGPLRIPLPALPD